MNKFEITIGGCLNIYYEDGHCYCLPNEDAIKLKHFLNFNHRELRPNKNWEMCSCISHADDCTCEDMGGDR